MISETVQWLGRALLGLHGGYHARRKEAGRLPKGEESMRLRRSLYSTLGVALLVTTAACGNSSDDSTGSASGSAGKYGMPSDVKMLDVGTSVGAPPYEFYESGSTEVKGYEPDLMKEIAKRLGVELSWRVTDFGALFTGLDTGRYTMLANGLIDRKSRQAKYDVLDYITDASALLGKSGSTGAIQSMDDVCGKDVGVPVGTSYEAFFNDQQKKCAADGKPKLTVTTFKDPTGVVLAVSTGRVDYGANQVPLVAYQASKTSGLEVSKFQYLEGLVGMVFPKDSKLIEPFGKVIDEMIADGTYAKILGDWGLEDLAVEKTKVNAATTE